MSYDLLVFEPDDAPRDSASFLDWYEEQMEWSEDHGENGPDVTTPRLSAWYEEMRLEFPNMNGPGACDLSGEDNPSATDYSFRRSVIYTGFAGSQGARAYDLVRALAVKHRVGFFDASGDGEIWFPPDKSESLP